MSKIQSIEIDKFVDQNLNKNFFKTNIPAEITAYTILDVSLAVSQSKEFEDKIIEMVPQDKKDELFSEIKVVEEEQDIEKLYKLLRKSLNPAAVNILIDKLLAKEKEILPRVLEDLKTSGNDNFIEAAVRLFVKSENDYSYNIAQILPHVKYPYAQAMASYLLGRIGKESHIEIVYNFFLALQNNYPAETYFEGPLLGLYAMKRDYEF